MGLGVACGTETEAVALADEGDQFVGVAKSARDRLEAVGASGRITPQRQDVLDPVGLERVEHARDVLARRSHTGDVGHRFDARVALDALDQLDGLVAGGSAGAVCHRYVAGAERPEGVDRLEEPGEPLLFLGRKELEGNRRRSGREHVADLHRRDTSGYHGGFRTAARRQGSYLVGAETLPAWSARPMLGGSRRQRPDRRAAICLC